jgi:hypothetical protein
VLRIKHRPLVTIEVSDGWVMCAIQAGGMAAPESVELSTQGRRGHPGPWPDVLLRLLREFRGHVQNQHLGDPLPSGDPPVADGPGQQAHHRRIAAELPVAWRYGRRPVDR